MQYPMKETERDPRSGLQGFGGRPQLHPAWGEERRETGEAKGTAEREAAKGAVLSSAIRQAKG